MAKKTETGDWYYDSGRHQEDLERDLAGLIARHQDLVDTPGAEAAQIEAAEAAVSEARENLRRMYGVGQKQAAKRPARARETRAKKK